MARSKSEPIFWSLFAAGGMLAALLYPIHILLIGVLFPTGIVATPSYDSIHSLFGNIIFKLFLIALIALPMFHFAHRFRFTLIDLGFKPVNLLLAVVFYGSAIVVTVLAVKTVLAI